MCRYSCMCREEIEVVKGEPGEFMEGETIEHGGRFMGWIERERKMCGCFCVSVWGETGVYMWRERWGVCMERHQLGIGKNG